MRKHSLSAAVADGTITDLEACCGIRSDHLSLLAVRHPAALLLVRLRNREGADARRVMSCEELEAWACVEASDDEALRASLSLGIVRYIGGHAYRYEDIRDVMAVSS